MSNIVEITNLNHEKYFRLKDYCKAIESCNQTVDSPDEIFNIIKAIKNFNINDVMHNYHSEYRYTTVLEFILKTQKHKIITAILEIYIDSIKKEIIISETLTNDLLTVLYSNLVYNNCKKEYLVPLIFKFGNLDFLKEEKSFEQKLIILRYLEKQKNNYPCTDEFLELIEAKYQEILQIKEKEIFSLFKKDINKIKNSIDELISDLKYEPNEEMKEFHRLIISLKNKNE